MNRKEIFWYTGKIIWRKDAIIICLFWSSVFFCLNALVVCGKIMDEQKKTAVGIRCEISQEYQDQLGILRNMEGVQAVTVWEESTQRLEWNGYEAEITLTGTDQEYLQTHFPKAYSQGKHSSMAWAVVDESIIKQLKDARKTWDSGICARRFIVSDCGNQWGKSKGIWNQQPERKQEEHQVLCMRI